MKSDTDITVGVEESLYNIKFSNTYFLKIILYFFYNHKLVNVQ